ncbi:hypothetical protein HDU89_006700 [Geranomyces variabilis]|nr:hypothetical protein HDU89_006700 [Geranomyces variabilis]
MLSVLSPDSPTTSRPTSPLHGSTKKYPFYCDKLSRNDASQVDYASDFESWSGSDSRSSRRSCSSKNSESESKCSTLTENTCAQDEATVEANDQETIFRMIAELGTIEQSLAEARAQEERDAEEDSLEKQSSRLDLPACGNDPAPPEEVHKSFLPIRQRRPLRDVTAVETLHVPKNDIAKHATLQEKAVRELLDDIHKDQSAAHAAERQLLMIMCRPNIRAELDPVVQDLHKSNAELLIETRQQVEHLSHLKAMVKQFWVQVNHPKPGQAYISSVQSLMESIESHLMIQKTASCETLETLVQQQNKLINELTAFQEHMAGWDQIPADQPSSVNHAVKPLSERAPSARSMTADDGFLLPEITAYQNFVARHGRFGGWEEFAHRAFLRLREKHGPATTHNFLRAVVARIPGIGLSEAASHAAWHESFLRLTEARRSSIGKWKTRKAVAAEDHERDMEAHETAIKKSGAKKQAIHFDRDAQRRELEAWKEQKRAEEVAFEQQQAAEAAAKKSKEARNRDHQRMLRERVKAYQQKREARDLLNQQIKQEAEQREKDLHNKIAQEDRKRLAEKNFAIAQKRRMAEAERAQATEQKERRLDAIRKQVEVHASRDPSRILRPTESFQIKVDSPSHDPSETVKGLFRTNPIPKRHMPNWRREM